MNNHRHLARLSFLGGERGSIIDGSIWIVQDNGCDIFIR